ncbi:MAG TPA: hypothetical protein VMR98_01165 [Candidatus Polarisedimenticolaceae bacterium]|nr:hypothetical protein [Candidatus Polarisedimenticolaceae bacterium]
MIKLNEKGFTAVGAVLIVVVLAAVAAAGYYAYQASQSKKSGYSAKLPTKITPAPKSDPKKVVALPGRFIRELGVLLPLSSDSKDLSYTFKDGKAYLNSVSFKAALGSKSKTEACTQNPLGTLSKVDGKTELPTDPAKAFKDGYEITKQFDGFYLKYTNKDSTGPRACDSSVAELQGKQIKAIVNAIPKAEIAN